MPKGTTVSDALSKRIGAETETIDEAYDAMYGLSATKDGDVITELDIDLFSTNPKDPFRPYTTEKLEELAESINKFGLLEPVIVRPLETTNGLIYEILSGKNRTNAEKLNGKKKIKSIIREVDDETAILIITDANLKHRDMLLPSEKGFAYRLQLEAITMQGKRTDLAEDSTSVHGEQKWSRRIVAEQNNVKDSEIQRYVRLTYLLPSLLENVDNRNIPLMSGVDLSYLNEPSQEAVLNYLLATSFKRKISVELSGRIRDEYEAANSLTLVQVRDVVEGIKTPKISSKFSIDRGKFKQFTEILPDDKELERLFIQFLNEKFSS